MPKFVTAGLSILGKIKREKRELNVNVNLGPLSLGATLPDMSDEPQPTRAGVNSSDKNTPFVETKLDTLYRYYYGYQNSKPHHQWAAYCDVTLLNQNGDGFLSGQNTNDLSVVIKPEGYSLPMSLRKHGEVALQLFKDLGRVNRLPSGEFECNVSARFIRWAIEEGKIEVQQGDYFSQIGSNITMDWASGHLSDKVDDRIATIRNCIERPHGGMLLPFSESVLANTLGVATFLYTIDGQILIPIRGNSQAIMSEGKGKFHCSASGVFKWQNFEGVGKSARFDKFIEGMHDEIYRELHITQDTYEIVPLAFARELSRGGKPQLFFCAKCKLPLGEVKKQMKLAEEKWEFFQEEKLPADSSLHKWLDKRDSVENDQKTIESCFTYEGWMGLLLIKAYLEKKSPF